MLSLIKAFLPVYVALLVPLANANNHDCEPAFLAKPSIESVALPRELKVSSDALTYLAQNKDHLELLRSLSHIFTVLNSADMGLDKLIAMLRENADDEELKQLTKLDEQDLALFKTMAGNIVSGVVRQSVTRGLSPSDLEARWRKEFDRLQVLLGHHRYREALVAMLNVPRSRRKFIHMWNTAAIDGKGSVMDDRDIDLLITKILRSQSSVQLKAKLTGFLTAFVYDVHVFGEKTVMEVVADSDDYEREYTIKRPQFLQALDAYLAEQLQVKTSIDDINEAIDFFVMGTPLPPTAAVFYQGMVDQAKDLLLPLKSEFARFTADRDRNSKAVVYTGPKLELRLIDLFQPTSGPRIRDKKTSSGNLGRVDSAANVEGNIPSELALREYTTFTSMPRALQTLKSGETYRFWFLRESQARLQSVRFSDEVLHWFRENEGMARQFLNAIHLGPARARGQAGVKMLTRKSSRSSNSVYEVKTNSGWRGLMFNIDGVWEFVMITEKSDQDRAVDFLTPISF